MSDFLFGFRVLLALGLIWQAGMAVLLILRISLSFVERLALGWALGSGFIAFQLLIFGLFGIFFNLGFILAPWAMLWAWVGWCYRGQFKFSFTWPKLSFLEFGLVFCLGILISTLFFRAYFHPVFEWDGWAIYDLKARAFYTGNGIQDFFSQEYYLRSAFDYPLFQPLLGAFFYLVVGQITPAVQTLTAIHYAALLGIFYAAARRYGVNRSLTLAITLLTATWPHLLSWSQQFYADVLLTLCVVSSILYAFTYLHQPIRQWLIISALLAAFASEVKLEGVLLVLPILGILLLRAVLKQERWSNLTVWASLLMAGYLPWFIYSRFIRNFTAPSNLRLSAEDGGKLLQNVELVPQVVQLIFNWLTQPTYQGWMWLAIPFALGLALWHWRLYARSWALSYLLAHTLGLLIPVLLFFTAGPQWIDPVRPGRYLLHFSILISFGLLVNLHHTLLIPSRRLGAGLIGIGLCLALAVDWGGDLLQVNQNAPFTIRPFSLIRQTVGDAQAMLPLSTGERWQLLDIRTGRPTYGRLIEVAHALTPSNENVAFYVQPDNQDSYLLQRSYYLLYPRKVFILRTPSDVQPENLRMLGVTSVIVYDRELKPGELLGQLVYQENTRYSLARLNATAESLPSNQSFQPTSVKFANGIELLGYQILPPLLEGPRLVTLFWRGNQTVPDSFTAFVHVLAAGELVAQHDGLPVFGQLPTQFWESGSLVTDAHPLPAEALMTPDAQICVGLYASNTGERLPIMTSDPPQVENNTFCFEPK